MCVCLFFFFCSFFSYINAYVAGPYDIATEEYLQAVNLIIYKSDFMVGNYISAIYRIHKMRANYAVFARDGGGDILIKDFE